MTSETAAATPEVDVADEAPVPDQLRLRLDLSYDGSGFRGWSRQPGLRTVQQVVEEALQRALSLTDPPRLTVAGRTDAGVHARGQVAHADVDPAAWAAAAGHALHRLAGLLPHDVRVRSVAPAPGGFDARFSALWRRYCYRVCDDPLGGDPLRRRQELWYPRRLDIARMNQAAALCLGTHDFAAFCRRRKGTTTVRTLLRFEWARPQPDLAVATAVADAFCHNMVRSLVGAMLAVGDGTREPGWAASLLGTRNRDPAVHVAPPHGLCLEEVAYPAAGLAERALQTRQVRVMAGGR
jgi:tRNA pseudouridine38-40 synthase